MFRAASGIAPVARWCALAALLTGCADARFVHRNCPIPPNPKAAADTPAPDAAYRIGCPDVLEVAFADRPGWDAIASVDLDGRLPLNEPGQPRVEGRTIEQVRDDLARLAEVSPDRVRVRLAAAHSGNVYLHGPIRGQIRFVPYQGPEPAIDFLNRVGGLPPGSKVTEVYVVRPNVVTAAAPEVFRVDVPAVVLDNNPATNVPLRPSDQVYIGETKGSRFSRMLPHWLGPTYRRLVGLLPDEWWSFTRPGPRVRQP